MNVERLTAAARILVGRRCVAYFAGGGGGSHVELEFEGPAGTQPDGSALGNVGHQTSLSAKYGVFVESSWRLDSNEAVVCGCWDDNSEGGLMLSGLERLVGLRLLDLDLSLPGLDADLKFEGYRLRVFCDQVNEVDGDDNYTIFTPERLVVVGRRSVLREETRGSWKSPSANLKVVPPPSK